MLGLVAACTVDDIYIYIHIYISCITHNKEYIRNIPKFLES